MIVDILAVRLLVPTTAVGVALVASDRGWGLFPMLGLPHWAAIGLGVIALDLVIYLQHRLFHYVPALWRLHRMHHADLDIDVTTGVRFHPLEILISLAIKIAAVVTLGVPAIAVLIFEVLPNATSMFNHSNVALPPRLEPVARWIVVTPQMHQVHHSIERAETDSNFGFNLPWWDRLFSTCCAEPKAGEDRMVVSAGFSRRCGAQHHSAADSAVPNRHTLAALSLRLVQSAEPPDEYQNGNWYSEQPQQHIPPSSTLGTHRAGP